MESTRFASLLLCVLYILNLHALAADPPSHAHQGVEMHADGLIGTGENVIPVKKELSDISTAGARKMMLRDRKAKKNEVLREEIEKQKEQNGETSRISGEGTNYTLKRTGKSQDQYDEQKTISESSSSLGVSGKLQVSDKNAGAHDHRHHHEKDESQRLLDEAADEIVSLMRKDYRGMDKPRRKPPINNHKPTD